MPQARDRAAFSVVSAIIPWNRWTVLGEVRMPTSSPPRTRTAQKTPPPSAKLDVIDNWLRKMLDRFPAKGQLTTSEIEDWHRDLAPFSLEAIEWAFEKMRMGLYFPMNGPVLDLCLSYEPPDTPNVVSTSTCDAICKARHWKGYGEPDMKELWKRMVRMIAAGENPDAWALLTGIDETRADGPPEWRR